jgi:Raf kinase inhibitor-like YbhB/YbcL family protein
MRIRLLLALALALGALLLTACGGDDGEQVSGPLPAAPDQIRLTSPVMKAGGSVPELYTCDGADVSPPLAWRGVPKEAKSLALIVEDPDADGGNKTFVHWTMYDVEPKFLGVEEGYVPPKAKEGENSFGRKLYNGPCPPSGDQPHRYQFALYALKAPTGLDAGASPSDVRDKIEQLRIARGVLEVSYSRAAGQ